MLYQYLLPLPLKVRCATGSPDGCTWTTDTRAVVGAVALLRATAFDPESLHRSGQLERSLAIGIRADEIQQAVGFATRMGAVELVGAADELLTLLAIAGRSWHSLTVWTLGAIWRLTFRAALHAH